MKKYRPLPVLGYSRTGTGSYATAGSTYLKVQRRSSRLKFIQNERSTEYGASRLPDQLQIHAVNWRPGPQGPKFRTDKLRVCTDTPINDLFDFYRNKYSTN